MSFCPTCKKDTKDQPFTIPTVVPIFKGGEVTKWVESSARCISCVECKNFKSQMHNFDQESPIPYKQSV